MVSPDIRQGIGKASSAADCALRSGAIETRSVQFTRHDKLVKLPADNNSLASFSPMAVGQWRVLWPFPTGDWPHSLCDHAHWKAFNNGATAPDQAEGKGETSNSARFESSSDDVR
jgi:hypothetical protein